MGSSETTERKSLDIFPHFLAPRELDEPFYCLDTNDSSHDAKWQYVLLTRTP